MACHSIAALNHEPRQEEQQLRGSSSHGYDRLDHAAQGQRLVRSRVSLEPNTYCRQLAEKLPTLPPLARPGEHSTLSCMKQGSGSRATCNSVFQKIGSAKGRNLRSLEKFGCFVEKNVSSIATTKKKIELLAAGSSRELS